MGISDTIKDSALKIKGQARMIGSEWLIMGIVILTGVISFGLGRLSLTEEYRPKVTLYERPLEVTEPIAMGGYIVASRQGSKYHFPWCAGAQSMSPANKIWFSSEEEARRYGYTPAGNCKGLTE